MKTHEGKLVSFFFLVDTIKVSGEECQRRHMAHGGLIAYLNNKSKDASAHSLFTPHRTRLTLSRRLNLSFSVGIC